MHIAFVKPGNLITCGDASGRFLRMSGPDALVELDNGVRVMWSGATEVSILTGAEEIEENYLPRLEAELARLEGFTIGKYATLGLTVDTPCIALPKPLHPPFLRGGLGERPVDAIVCRRCSTKLCIRADHLFWGTRSDCQRDMCLRGVARPSGKQVTVVNIALQIVKIRLRISRLTAKLIS